MVSKQSQRRIDSLIVLYFLVGELFDREEQDKIIEELAVEEALFPGVTINNDGSETPVPPIDIPIFSSSCPKSCCGWHAQAAAEILSDEKTKTDENAFEDGGVDAAFLRGLVERVFEKVAEHYNITPSTASDQATRTFGNKNTDDFFGIFLSGLHRDKSIANPITLALEQKRAGGETDYDIRNYVNSLGYQCVIDWLY